jgi:hypothetical protein
MGWNVYRETTRQLSWAQYPTDEGYSCRTSLRYYHVCHKKVDDCSTANTMISSRPSSPSLQQSVDEIERVLRTVGLQMRSLRYGLSGNYSSLASPNPWIIFQFRLQPQNPSALARRMVRPNHSTHAENYAIRHCDVTKGARSSPSGQRL